MTHDVFISFSTHDRLVAERVMAHLHGQGMTCWMSAAAIEGGEVWTRAIVDGISAARVMVLILSESSNGSEHVRREIYLARERRLRIIPFRIDSVEPDGDLAYNLAGIQWIQGSAEPVPAELDRLGQSVRGYLARTSAPKAEVATPPTIPHLHESPRLGADEVVEEANDEPEDPPTTGVPAIVSAQPPADTEDERVPAEEAAIANGHPRERPQPAAGPVSGDVLATGAPQRGLRVPIDRKARLLLGGLVAALLLAVVAVVLLLLPGGEKTRHTSELTYTAVSAADGNIACGVLSGGAIRCWGTGSETVKPPAESFSAIAVVGLGGCAIGATGELSCWYRSELFKDTPGGMFTQVVNGWIPCGVRADASAVCWGANAETVATGAASPPPAVKFKSISRVTRDSSAPNATFGCGVTLGDALVCWGKGVPEAPKDLGAISAVGVGDAFVCVLKADRTIACWGKDGFGQTKAPSGSFVAISVGDVRACALNTAQRAVCWGLKLPSGPPDDRFTSIDVGGNSACAIRTDGRAVCWGDNQYMQLEAP